MLTLKHRSQFVAVAKQGDAAFSNSVVLQFLKSGVPESRFGFTVTKKVGGAVVRNKIKRRLKSIIREVLLQDGLYQDGFNYVLVYRQQAIGHSYESVKKDVLFCFKKAFVPRARRMRSTGHLSIGDSVR